MTKHWVSNVFYHIFFFFFLIAEPTPLILKLTELHQNNLNEMKSSTELSLWFLLRTKVK